LKNYIIFINRNIKTCVGGMHPISIRCGVVGTLHIANNKIEKKEAKREK